MDFIKTTDDLVAIIAALEIAERKYESDAVFVRGTAAMNRRKAAQARRLARWARRRLKANTPLLEALKRRGYDIDPDAAPIVVLCRRWTSGRYIRVSNQDALALPTDGDWRVDCFRLDPGRFENAPRDPVKSWLSGTAVSLGDAISAAETYPVHMQAAPADA